MLERMTFSGGPLTGAVIEAEFSRDGIDVKCPTRYPSRIIVEYDTVMIKENAEMDDATFAHGRHTRAAEYELDYETGCYNFLQNTMKPKKLFEVDDA